MSETVRMGVPIQMHISHMTSFAGQCLSKVNQSEFSDFLIKQDSQLFVLAL